MTATRALRWLRSSHARFIGLILLLELVFGGALLFDRADPKLSPRMDFELGMHDNGFTGGAGQ